MPARGSGAAAALQRVLRELRTVKGQVVALKAAVGRRLGGDGGGGGGGRSSGRKRRAQRRQGKTKKKARGGGRVCVTLHGFLDR